MAIVLALFIVWLLLKFQLLTGVFHSLGKGASQRVPFFLAILNVVYIGCAFAIRENFRNWFYKQFGNLTERDFIEVLEGKFTSRFPAPKIIPVWVTISAKLVPIALVSVIPGFIFGLLGWGILQVGAIVVFLLYLSEVVSSFYYMAFWDRYMIEYIKQGSSFGIIYFDVYFFLQENQEAAIKYIDIKQSV